jgi:hypothetical protein
MRTRMLVVIAFTIIFFLAGFGGAMSQQQESPGTINGAEIADGLPQADGTRQA